MITVPISVTRMVFLPLAIDAAPARHLLLRSRLGRSPLGLVGARFGQRRGGLAYRRSSARARSSRSQSSRRGAKPIASTRRRGAAAPGFPWREGGRGGERSHTEPGRAACVSARPAGRWRRARPRSGRGNPTSSRAARWPKSWLPRIRRRRPGQFRSRATRASSSNADGCATSPTHTMVSPGETLLVQASSMRPSIARRLGNGRPVASNAPRSRRWRSDQIHVSAGGASMPRTGPPRTSRASSYSAPVTPATRGGKRGPLQEVFPQHCDAFGFDPRHGRLMSQVP